MSLRFTSFADSHRDLWTSLAVQVGFGSENFPFLFTGYLHTYISIYPPPHRRHIRHSIHFIYILTGIIYLLFLLAKLFQVSSFFFITAIHHTENFNLFKRSLLLYRRQSIISDWIYCRGTRFESSTGQKFKRTQCSILSARVYLNFFFSYHTYFKNMSFFLTTYFFSHISFNN